jgi:RHS repeat-associated protein
MSQKQQKKIVQPEISLPKGGGAINGMGDHLQGNSFTGSASFSIPFPLTAARGFEPSLSVVYSSGSGNGLCGMGGEISISGISRKTSNGIPRYDGTDIFTMGGGELVPKLQFDVKTEQWEPETRREGEWQITAYSPRIEGAFSLIEHWEQIKGIESYWIITSADNHKSIYGRSAQARVADAAEPRKIFSWLPERENDDHGNIIQYHYEHDTDGSYAYLKTIDYGNYYDNDCIKFAFSAVIDYGTFNPENPGDIPTGFVARPDAFSSFVSGFEIRISRLVHHVLLYHQFAGQYDGVPFLVKSMNLRYGGTSGDAGGTGNLSGLSFLRAASVTGFLIQDDGSYQLKTIPPLELSFTDFFPKPRPYDQLRVAGAENIPGYVGEDYQLIDLNNDGLPGFLYSTATTSFYYEPVGEGAYRRPAILEGFPSARDLTTGVNIITSLSGNGVKDLVVENPGSSGYYKNTGAGQWNGFEVFSNQATESAAQGRQWVDLTGNGLADLVFFEPDTLKLYPGLGIEGFDTATRVPFPHDFPATTGNNEEVLQMFANMLGDGVEHYVRISNGRVECWPSTGYGHFGAMRLLHQAPFIDNGMDVRRLKLADIDGSGTADIIYVAHDHIKIWINQSGNQFSAPLSIPLPVGYDQISQVNFADINGTGTSCIVVTVSEPEVRHYYYDFCDGKKPYLLETSKNNLGTLARYTYSSSVKQYLRDKRNGRYWPTKLFFPVHIVDTIELMDEPSSTFHIEHYAYHDGYYDADERVFRGFGFVETWNTDHYEAYAAAANNAGFPVNTINEELHSAPVYTKSWYHNGAYAGAWRTSAFYQKEFFSGDDLFYSISGQQLQKAILDADAQTLRQAYAAMEGQLLRQEVYGLDGSAQESNPFTVSETELSIRLVQPRQDQRYAVFLTHERQAMQWQYERNPDDPRVTHTLNLLVDKWGNVTRNCNIYYPRRTGNGNFIFDEQKELKITLSCSRFAFHTQPDSYYLGVPYEDIDYEITGAILPAGGYFSFTEADKQMEGALNRVIDYHNFSAAKKGALTAWINNWEQQYYWNDDLTAVSQLGAFGTTLLSHHDETAVYPESAFNQRYDGLIDPADIVSSTGYINHDNYYWNAGLTQYYLAREYYFLSSQQQNSFAPAGNTALQPVSSVGYDHYYLRATSTTQVLTGTPGIVSVAEIDYRLMQPCRVTDPNGNISEALFDPLGYVVVSTLYGTLDSASVGFLPLSSYTPVQDKATTDAIITDPQKFLQNAGSYFYYDLFAWMYNKQPVCSIVLQPIKYTSQLKKGEANLIKIGISFSDGTCRALVAKTNTDPGSTIVHDREGNFVFTPGTRAATSAQSRWLCTGRTVYDNKGNPVQQFEPYFSDTWAYETTDVLIDEKEVVPPSVLHYDALERVIQTDTPKGFITKTTFTPWDSKIYDANDTILDSPYYQLHKDELTKINANLPQSEADAIKQAIACYNSPSVNIYDALGHTVRSVSDNLGAVTSGKLKTVLGTESAATDAINDLLAAGWITPGTAEPSVYWLTDTFQPYTKGFARNFTIGGENAASLLGLLKKGRLTTLQIPDIQGRTLITIDPRLLWSNLTEQSAYYNFNYLYAMPGNMIQTQSTDAGNTKQLQNIFSATVHLWDPRNFHITSVYDQLQRSVKTQVSGGDGLFKGTRTTNVMVYGDYAPDAATYNLTGQPWKVYDDAGVVVSSSYGIAGEALTQQRYYRPDYRTGADWNEIMQDEVLRETPFVNLSAYNALGLPLQAVYPDGSIFLPAYNIAGQLITLDIAFADGTGDGTKPIPVNIISNVAYDASGRALYIAYGNNSATRCTVEASTQQLINQRSYRLGKPGNGAYPLLQDVHYTYDPAGNVTARRDNSLENILNANQLIAPVNRYGYDLIYQLIYATGRQKKQQPGGATHAECRFMADYHIPLKYTSPNDGQALENYTERYAYDDAGNLLQLKHQAGKNWTWNYGIADDSNRLTTNGDRTMHYDAGGNLSTLESLSVTWNYRNELTQAVIVARDEQAPDAEYYQYDPGGNRVRKVTERLIHNGSVKEIEEKLYIGIYAYKRITQVAADPVKNKERPEPLLEKQTLSINGPQGLCCVTHNWLTDVSGRETDTLQRTFRYQYADILKSVGLETNAGGLLLSYEEYYPYGGTAFAAAANQLEIAMKEYRYSGQEQDSFTGLYYYGMRYYPPWLCRWLNPDPGGTVDGLNLYAFLAGNPATHYDVDGMRKPSAISQGRLMNKIWRSKRRRGRRRTTVTPNVKTTTFAYFGRTVPKPRKDYKLRAATLGAQVANEMVAGSSSTLANLKGVIKGYNPGKQLLYKINKPNQNNATFDTAFQAAWQHNYTQFKTSYRQVQAGQDELVATAVVYSLISGASGEAAKLAANNTITAAQQTTIENDFKQTIKFVSLYRMPTEGMGTKVGTHFIQHPSSANSFYGDHTGTTPVWGPHTYLNRRRNDSALDAGENSTGTGIVRLVDTAQAALLYSVTSGFSARSTASNVTTNTWITAADKTANNVLRDAGKAQFPQSATSNHPAYGTVNIATSLHNFQYEGYNCPSP